MKLGYRKLIDIIILVIAKSSQAYDELKFIPEELTPTWRNMLKITDSNQTLFIHIDNDTSVMFKDSVFKSIHHDQSVLLISVLPETDFGVKIRTIVERNVNIVFITKFLDPNMLDTPLMSFMLKSHWSVLFIIVTIDDSLYKCDDGKFGDEAKSNIEHFLNYLWHKHRIMRVFLNLPYVCPNEYVVYNGTEPTDGELYNRTIKVVQTDEQLSEIIAIKYGRFLTRNYPLRGNIFYRFPTAIQDCLGTDIYINTSEKYSGGFCGLDGLVMSDIVTHFEFNLSLPKLSPGYNKHGYQREDGVVTGSLGHIVRRDVDISFNSRFMVQYTNGTQQYRYMYFVAYDALCAVLNQPDEEPLWQYSINAYTLPQWLFIIACFTAIGLLMWLFAKFRKNMHNSNASTLLGYIVNSINAGLFGFFLKRRKDLLLFRASCLLASIIVLAKYQSYINYIFTTRVRYDTLNSLSDLAEREIVIQTSPSIYILIQEPVNEIGRALLSRTIVLDNAESFEFVLHHKNTATLDRQSDAIILTLMKYTDDTGRPLLYVVNDCLRVFYLSYITTLEFPFANIISIFMMRLVETGLPKMYYSWTCRALGLEVTLPNIYSEPRPAAKITMREQIIPFGVLLVGYCLAVVAFMVEIWLARRQTYPLVH